MNVIETKSEGLSREYRVSIPKGELAAKFNAKITELQPKMNLKGFRPGKVPAAHIKKMSGKSIMADIVNDVVQETSDKALAEKALRPASRPSIKLDGDQDKLINGEADLDYSMALEVMPDFEPTDVTAISLERWVAEVPAQEIEESLKRLADNNKAYETKEGKAETGDAVVIDFVGSIDGEKFDGGAAEGHTLVLGSGRFIPGFEDQLVGASAGAEVKVNVNFPDDYQAENLKGKPALFEVKVHEVKAPKDVAIDDEFAKTLGLESLEALKDAIKGQISGELNFATRQQVKRVLLDALDERHSFDLPPLMVKAEFEQIWSQFEGEKKAGRLSEEDKAKSDDELRAEYQKIAERRVRLGLVLAEVGEKAEVKVADEEVSQAVVERARQFPGQEKAVWDYYTKNQEALAQLRAPIYEEKVVDHIIGLAKVTEKTVSKEDLLKQEEETKA